MTTGKNAPNASPVAIWAAMFTIYIIWGSTYLAIRFAVETLPPFLMASVRFLIAGGILYLWRRLSGDKRPTRPNLRSALVIGVLLLLGGNGGVSWAEQRVVSGVAALLVGTVPLWMVLIDSLRGARRPNAISIAGVLMGFAGIAVLVAPWEGLNGGVDWLGAGAVVLASFLWASGSLYSRTAELPDSALMGTALEMLLGGAALLLFGTVIGEWSQVDLAAVSLRSLGGLGWLIVMGSLVAYSAYTWLLRVAPTTLVSTYAYVNPMVAIFLGNLLANEPVTPRVLIAALIIIGAVVLITRALPPLAKESVPEEAV